MADTFTLIRVADTETTGLDDPVDMVEIGWTDVRRFPTGWAIEGGPFSRLVRPTVPISFPAMATHHISEAEAATGISQDEARALLAGADYLCAHNWAYDSRFIKDRTPAICTFKAARTAWPELQSHKNGSIWYERGLGGGAPQMEPVHRAGPDSWTTAHILLDLLKIYPVETLVEMTRNPVRLLKIPFGQHFGKRFSEVDVGWLDWCIRKMGDDPSKEDVVFSARCELRDRREQRRV